MLIFLDIKTTGYEKEDKICSLGALFFENRSCVSSLYELVNEGKKIPSKASALHNITNEMIQEKPVLRESEIYKYLQIHNKAENTLIVHNADFVLPYLKDVGLKWYGKIIDTQKVLKHHIPECEFFNLEFIRYELKLYTKEEPHRQLCGIKDAFVVKLLFDYLLEELSQEMMQELSFKNVLLEKFPFGKYAGRYIEEIVESDRSYLLWMLSLESLDDDLAYSLKYYLQG